MYRILGLLHLMVGVVFYVCFRNFDAVFYSSSYWGSIPSFLFVAGFTFWHWHLVGQASFKEPIIWFFVLILHELTQLLFGWGVFDSYDIFAGMVSIFYVHAIFYFFRLKVKSSTLRFERCSLIISAALAILATSKVRDYPPGPSPDCGSVDSLVNPVFEPAKPIVQMDAVYTYEDLLLISDSQDGLHVFDNTNPSQPNAMGFLRFKNTAGYQVKDGFLYAMQDVHLVILDLKKLPKIEIVKVLPNALGCAPLFANDFSDGAILGDQLEDQQGENLASKLPIEKHQCQFGYSYDFCLVLEASNESKILHACEFEPTQIDSASKLGSCSLDIKGDAKILSYFSFCSEENQAPVSDDKGIRNLNFYGHSCGDEPHLENIPHIAELIETYKSQAHLNQNPEAIENIESKLKQLLEGGQ